MNLKSCHKRTKNNLFSIPASELKKRVAISSNIKQEKKQRKKVETTSGLDVPSPTEAIAAFGWNGNKTQILRSGQNKWEEWERRIFGCFPVCVRVKKNIFIIGEDFFPRTDIYNIVTNTWSKGPKLNIRRLDESSLQLHESVKPNAF